MVRGNELILRPVHRVGSGEFAEQILSELINEGLSGAELLREFKKRQAQVRPAVEAMISDADNAAKGEGEYIPWRTFSARKTVFELFFLTCITLNEVMI